jgi:hypothetical protein
MRATCPTAGAAHSASQFRDRFLYSDNPRLSFLGRDNPTDPFVARERCNILPNF